MCACVVSGGGVVSARSGCKRASCASPCAPALAPSSSSHSSPSPLQPDALFVIVPALALPTKLAAAAYIIMFVFGTVAAMGAYTGVIGATSAAIKKSNSGLTQKLSGFASCAAIAIGITVLAGGWGIELPLLGGGGAH